MDNNKQRAIGILFVLGSILVLMATWDVPERRPSQVVIAEAIAVCGANVLCQY
jgi:hypothetical protein